MLTWLGTWIALAIAFAIGWGLGSAIEDHRREEERDALDLPMRWKSRR